jgi:2-iminobutanoate/2-iminopropanoate deaminase
MTRRIIDHPDWGISTMVINGDLAYIGHFGGHTKDGKKLRTIEEQTEETLRNLAACLEANGMSMESVLQLNVALRRMRDFNRMHSVWARWFPKEFPARMTHSSDFVDGHCLIQVYGVAAVGK